MAFNSSRMQRIATKHIKASGTTLNFKRTVSGEYDPSTGTSVDVDTIFQFSTTTFNYPIKNSGEEMGIGNLIEANDRMLIVLPRNDVTPSVGNWKVFLDNDWWTVINIKHETYSTTPIYMEVQVRLV